MMSLLPNAKIISCETQQEFTRLKIKRVKILKYVLCIRYPRIHVCNIYYIQVGLRWYLRNRIAYVCMYVNTCSLHVIIQAVIFHRSIVTCYQMIFSICRACLASRFIE